MKQFGELPRTANAIWPAIIAGAAAVGSALISKNSGGSSGSQSSERTPAAWEPESKAIWDQFLKQQASGTRENLANKYSSVLSGLSSQFMRPAYSIKIGGQTVPVIPRRNLQALDSAAKTALAEYGVAVDPLDAEQNLAMDLQKLRYGSSGTTETGDLSRTPSVLENIGIGADVFKSVYPAAKGITTTPTTAKVEKPYYESYKGY